ncbi:MAG: dihydroneopterin aldolase [Zhongshania sp.]|jgi:dihydroneopterin aldolase|uniref:dihydroneopterin aldolase n=1 Tax=Zhongshania sp. TaxID=1971902 RepID=UPI0039E4DF53
MDIVYIRGLQVDTIIGIYDFERAHRQILVLDLELGTDIRPAAASDDIALTLNYKAITETVEDFVKRSEFYLVETLAQRCAELIMTDFAVPWMRLSLSKPGAMRQAKDVGIIIERGRR